MGELIVSKNKKKIFSFFVSNATEKGRSSVKGEVDIILRGASKNPFELCSYIDKTERREFKEISSVSWHGFYENISSGIREPVIRLKMGEEIKTEIRHSGFIGIQNPFFYMICSLYIPKSSLFETAKNLTGKEKNKNQIIEVDDVTTRIDFFILPKSIKMEKFLETPVGLLYFFGDITVFDPMKNGEYKEIVSENKSFSIYKLEEWYVLVKKITEDRMKEREPLHSSKYSLLLHYTEQSEYIFNRTFAYPNSKPENLHDLFIEKYFGISHKKIITPYRVFLKNNENINEAPIYPYILIGAYKKNTDKK